MMGNCIARVSAAAAVSAAIAALGATGVSAAGAATRARLWVSRYNGPANGKDVARAVAVSPGGGTVYVTGDSPGSQSSYDYATVAYNAATGARLWVSRYNGPGNAFDIAYSVAVSPDGARCMSPEPAPEQWLPMNRLTTRRWPTTPPLA